MSNEKISPEFEAWFKECFWHECYEDVKHHLFSAWQASRAAIEAPSFKMYSHEGYDYYDAESVDNAMEDLGIKVKS